MDVLIDTGSAGLGVPIETPANWTDRDFQRIDVGKAAVRRRKKRERGKEKRFFE